MIHHQFCRCRQCKPPLPDYSGPHWGEYVLIAALIALCFAVAVFA